MSISMYRLTVPMFQRGIASLKTYLDKAEAYAEEKKIDPSHPHKCTPCPGYAAAFRPVSARQR